MPESQTAPLLRDIASELDKHLMTLKAHFEYVATYEKDQYGTPTETWPADASNFVVGMVRGNSEGYSVNVYAQPERYEHGNLVPLLRVKVIGSKTHVSETAKTVMDFVEAKQP